MGNKPTKSPEDRKRDEITVLLIHSIINKTHDVTKELMNGYDINYNYIYHLKETNCDDKITLLMFLLFHMKNETDILKVYEKSTNLNYVSPKGETCLSYAIYYGRLKVAERILNNKIYIYVQPNKRTTYIEHIENIKNNYGETPLFLLIRSNVSTFIEYNNEDIMPSILKTLINKTNVLNKNKKGETVIDIALHENKNKTLTINTTIELIKKIKKHYDFIILQQYKKTSKDYESFVKTMRREEVDAYTNILISAIRFNNRAIIVELINNYEINYNIVIITPTGSKTTLLMYAIIKNVDEDNIIRILNKCNNYNFVHTGTKDTALLRAVVDSKLTVAYILLHKKL